MLAFRAHLLPSLTAMIKMPRIKTALLCLTSFASQASAQLVLDGLTLDFNANQDVDGNGRWESIVSNSPLDLRIDPAVIRSTTPLNSGFAGITNTYQFPGSGTTAADNTLGAELSTPGSATNTSSFENVGGSPEESPASWEMWFRPASMTSTGGVDQVLFEDGGGTGVSLSIKDGILSARKLPTLAVKTFDISGLTATDFVQAVMTYNTVSDELELYVNGVVVPGGPASSAGGEWTGGDGVGVGTRGASNMGGFGGGSQNVASFQGDIATLRFYETALTATQVTANYNAVNASTVFFDNEDIDPFWASGLNWDTNIAPTSAQGVVINHGGAVVLESANGVASTLTLGSNATSTLNAAGGSTGELSVSSGGSLTVVGVTTVGDGQDGTLNLIGGTFDSGGDILGGTSTSTVTLAGGTLEFNGNNLGTAGNLITTLNFASGTLRNIGGINNGAGLVKNLNGTLTLEGTNAYSGGTTIDAGTIALGANDALPSTGTVTINTTGALDLATFTNTVGTVTLAGGSIEGSTGVLTSTADYVIESGIINGSLGGTVGLTKSTTGLVKVNGTSAYTGATTINAGILITGSANAINSASATTVNSGGRLNFFDGTGATTFNVPTLTLAGGSAIGGELGGNFTTSTAATASGTIGVDVYASPAVANPAGTPFILVNAASGLSGGTYQIGNVFGNTNWTVVTGNLTTSDTQIQVTPQSATAITTAFWKGGFGGGSNIWSVSDGSTTSNWATDLGGTDTGVVPGATTDVTFSATTAGSTAGTLLGVDMSINTLTVNDASGLELLADGSTLTINNSAGSTGLTVGSGAGPVSIATDLHLGGSLPQIRNDSASDLTISGAILSASYLEKRGTGKLILTGDNTFTGDFDIFTGDLQIGAGGTGGSIDSGANLRVRNGNSVILNRVDGLNFDGEFDFESSGGGGTISVLSGTNVFNGTFTMQAAGTIDVATGATWTLGTAGTGTNISMSTDVFTFTGAGYGTVHYSFASGNAAANIVKNGTGTWEFTNGANNYAGSTTVNDGVLFLNATAGGAMNNSSDLTINGGSVLLGANNQIKDDIPVTLTSSTATLDLGNGNSDTIDDLIFNSGGRITGSNGASLNIRSAGSIEILSGTVVTEIPVTGNVDLNKTTTGTATLQGALNHTGVTHIASGTLELDLSFGNTGLLGNSNVLSLAGGSLILRGDSGASLDSSETFSSDPVFAANTSSILGINSNGGQSTTLNLGNNWNPGANAFLVVNYENANTASFVNTGSAITGTGALTGGIFPYLIVKDSSGTGFGTQDGSFNIVRNTNTTALSSTNSTPTTGTTDFTTHSSDPDYDAPGGTLLLDTNTPHAVNTLVVDTTGGGILDLNGGRMTFTQGALAVTGTGAYTIQNGQLGSDNQTLLVFTDSTGDLTLNTTVSGGLGGFVKQGSGTLVLAGTNTYTGETIVGGGTLQLGSTTALDSATDLVLTDVANAIFELNGFNTTVASLSGGGSIGGTIALGANSLTVGGDSTSTTYAGSITGNGSFVKDGTGTLTLTGNSSYTGSTTVNAGILNLQSGGALGPAGVINVTTGATLQFQGGITVNSGDLNLQTGAAIGQNGGLVNMGGNNSFNGRVNVQGSHSAIIAVDSGTLTIDNGNTTNLGLGANTLTLLAASGSTINIGSNGSGDNIGMGNSTLILDGAGNGNLRTKIANGNAAGIVIKNGTGTWNLSQSYAGTNGWSLLGGETAHLRVNAGTIQLGANNAVSYGNGKGLVEVNGGTLDLNGFATNLNGLSNIPGQTAGIVTNNGVALPVILTLGHGDSSAVYRGTLQDGTSAISVTKTGTGTQSLAGTNSISGTITVDGGTLVMAGNTVSAASLSIASGATFQNVSGTAGVFNLGNGSIALSLADGSTFGTELGSTITVASGSTVSAAGTITVDVFNIPGSSPSGTITLATAPDGGFSGATTYELGRVLNPTNFTLGNLVANNTDVTIDATAATPLATAYWNGGFTGSSNVWAISDGTAKSNWSTTMDGTGATPLVPGAGTSVILSSTIATDQSAMVLGANMSIDSLTISDTNATSLDADGFSLTINNSGGNSGITMDSGAGASTLSSSVILGGSVPTITNNSTTSDLTIGGEISGTAGVTKEGAGKLIYTAANTYTGGTAINNGTLQIGDGGVTGSLGSGAVTGTGTATLIVNRTGTTTFGDTVSVPNLQLDAGTTRLTANTTVTNSFVSTVSGALETTGNITLDLTSAATATNQGGLTVISDTLTIKPTTVDQSPTGASFYYSFDNMADPFNDDSGATVYDGIQGAGASALPSFSANGKVGAAVTFDGSTQGLQAGGAQNTILSDAESVLTYASWIKLDSITSPSTIIFEEGGATNGLTLWTENGDLNARIQNGGGSGTVTNVNAPSALTTGWHHVAVSYSDSTFRLYLDGVLVDSAGFAATLSAHGDDSGIGYLQGSTPFTPTNTFFSGAMDEVYYFDDAGLTASQIASLVNGMSVTSLGALTLNDGTTVNVDGSAANSAVSLFGPVTSQGDATITGSGELIGTTFVVDPDKTLTVNNAIVGRVGLTVNGPGTVTLNGTNTFDGRAKILGGTLTVSSDTNLGSVPTTAEADRIFIDGGTLRTTADFTISSNRGITLGTSNGTVQTDASTTLTVGSMLSGSGTLTKAGAGTMLLTGDSSASFTGITQISEGTLQVAAGASTGTGDLIVNGSDTVLSGSGTVAGNTSVILGSISPGDPGTASGIGTLTLAGTTTDLTAGSILDLQITHSNGLGSVATNLDGSGNLDWTAIESAARNAGTSDVLTFTGLLNLVTDSTVNLAVADAGTFEKGMAWDLVDWVSLGTTPTNLNFNIAFATELTSLGLALDTSRFATHGIVAIVPEPSRVCLMMLGTLAFALRRRRRHA